MKEAEKATAAAFREISKRAEAGWQGLWHGEKPAVLVGAATCGRAAGALEVAEAFRDVNIPCYLL